MTLRHKLIKKYHRRELITVCCVSFQEWLNGQRDTLEHCIDGVWIEMKPPLPKNAVYKYYSHGISPANLKKYYPQLYKKLKEGEACQL